MTETLEQLLSRLSEDQTLLRSVEEATKQGAILPILAQLGWNCFDLQEVVPEFPVGSGRIDYCLKIGHKKAVFIEVKRATEDLERHEKQLLEYSFADGVDIAILTNGLVWWFYLPLVGGSWKQRKFFAIDIRQQRPKSGSSHFEQFLSRKSVDDGSAISKAKSVKESREKDKLIDQTVPKAWKLLIEEPDELLLELFADKVESLCGHSPDLEVLTDYVKTSYLIHSKKPTPSPTPTKLPPTPTDPHKTRKRRGVVVTVGNETISALTVPDLYYKTLKFLCDNKLMEKAASEIPYATSAKRYLIAKEPYHQRGNSFRLPVEHNGYFMEAHKSYENALVHLEAFLKTLGLKLKY